MVATVKYQAASVPTGLYAEYTYPPKVGVRRDLKGDDVEVFGVEPRFVQVPVLDGRPLNLNLDEHGTRLLSFPFVDLDYFDLDVVVRRYYPDCCRLVQEATGARAVLAFDHNLRSTSSQGRPMGGGFVTQGPLGLVHGDYTEASARNRIRDLTKPPKQNDTLRRLLGDEPPISDASAEDLLQRRFVFINVWRSIHPEPVERQPLGILSPGSVPLEDIVVHEIHYDDRIGENYNARFGAEHVWWAFPGMRRDEALLLKCWDSAGELSRHPPADGVRVPATFAFHSALDTPHRAEAPDRESIEVRLVAFF